mmetsp:Transcript_664/g.900  ORF Transcript_664/g.900 Transcript_664/m.900 type:complete len:539 (+) Transcript_664:23-1639(+)
MAARLTCVVMAAMAAHGTRVGRARAGIASRNLVNLARNVPVKSRSLQLFPHAKKSTVHSRSLITNAQVDTEDKQEKKDSLLPSWLPLFAVPALGGSLFGYDIGATSSVVRLLGTGESDLGSLDALQLGLVASLPLLGAVLASAAIIFTGDEKVGRKDELYIASFLYAVGTLVQSLAPSLSLVLGGRLLYGLGIGVAMHAAPLYIAETSPDNLRGKLVSLKEAAIVLGIVAGYTSGAVFNNGDPAAWRNVFEVALPFEALMAISTYLFLSESPRWLALRGRGKEAIESLMRGQALEEADAKADVDRMMEVRKMTQSDESTSFFDRSKELAGDPTNRKALLIGVGLVLWQQLSGQPSVLYYANRIFEKAGLGFEAAIGVGLFKTVMTLLSVGLVEDPKWGRKSLLLAGTSGMTVSLAALSALFATSGGEEPSAAAILACVIAFVGFYQIGFGPVTWLILSEIFPLKVRSAALSIGTLSNFASNFLVSALFEVERESLGEAALFAQFAIIAALAVAFEYTQVFETQGLSLEEIESKLKDSQ